MYDAWGRRFRYAVSVTMTASGAFSGACPLGAITVNDSTGAARTTDAAYALISAGANGHGGFTSNGVIFSGGSTNTDERTNCHCNSSGSVLTYSGTYVEKLPTASSGTYTNAFDDLVTFAEAWQLQTPSTYSSAIACVSPYYLYVADASNTRVAIFSSTGSYITDFGGGGSFVGGFSPTAIATDSSGNLYTTPYPSGSVWTYGIRKFNSAGSYLGSIGSFTQGTGLGQMGPVAAGFPVLGMAIDTSGNIWMPDRQNYRMYVLNQSGSILFTFGGGGNGGTCPAASTCTVSGSNCAACTSTSSCYCNSGTDNGQFSSGGPNHVAIDSFGSVWATDTSNNRVEKFDGGGNFLLQIPCASGPCAAGDAGSFQNVTDIAFDSSGNIYLLNGSRCDVEEFNSSGSYITEFLGPGNCGNASGSIPSSNAYGLAVDPNGNFWLSDQTNQRVEEWNSAGSFLRQIGCASGACSAGSTTKSQFNNPYGLAITNSR
jgi:hypothetical protein